MSNNITMDHVGHITIKLADYFSFPKNFKKLFNDNDQALKWIFRFSFGASDLQSSNYTCEMLSYTASRILGWERRKRIEERTVEELTG